MICFHVIACRGTPSLKLQKDGTKASDLNRAVSQKIRTQSLTWTYLFGGTLGGWTLNCIPSLGICICIFTKIAAIRPGSFQASILVAGFAVSGDAGSHPKCCGIGSRSSRNWKREGTIATKSNGPSIIIGPGIGTIRGGMPS